jgi:glyoxylase-like metal-dependent hydrolase (beta-lactamase superfamily II)
MLMKVHTLDLNFQGTRKAIASYLVEGPTGFVLIETGPGSSLKTLIARLAEKGLATTDIGHVLVTHIHLDHAGAAGWFAQNGAQLYVHHVGAPHLIDPSRLLDSAGRIYGPLMDSLWGATLPAPAERVTSLYDEDEIDVAGLSITALDTPGHAYHHHVFVIDNVAFTGDAAGVRIEGTSLVDLPAPPPEFNLEVWLETINRLQSYKFKVLYPTHFGSLDDPERHLATLSEIMVEASSRVKQRLEAGADRQEIVEDYLIWHRSRAELAGMSTKDFERDELANPHYMSVDGITRYWSKKGIPSRNQQSKSRESAT